MHLLHLCPRAIVGLLLAVVGVAACSQSPPTATPSMSAAAPTPGPSSAPTDIPHTLIGELRLTSFWVPEQPCYGAEHLTGMQVGGSVTIADESHVSLGGSVLRGGTVVDDATPDDLEPQDCLFTFEVAKVPRVASYTIAVAGYVITTLSFAELEDAGWHVELVVGPQCGLFYVCPTPSASGS